jgi:UDP-N-acetyl-D-mannosaminuronic acid transferase (WecB/TagA/CpsF family)
MEWLWRAIEEPSRMILRYIAVTIGFGFAVVQDQLLNLREGQP